METISGEPTRALAHLRFYLQNAAADDPKDAEAVLDTTQRATAPGSTSRTS